MDSNDDEKRVGKLYERIQEKTGELIKKDVVREIVSMENEMTENKDYLSALYDRNIVTSKEFADKINKCFEVFVENVSNIVGNEICEKIYDFHAGQKIELVSNEKIDKNYQTEIPADRVNISLKSRNKEIAHAYLDDLEEQFLGYAKVDIQRASAISSITVEAGKILGVSLLPLSFGALQAMNSILSHWIAKRGETSINVNIEGNHIEFPENEVMTEEEIRSLIELDLSIDL